MSLREFEKITGHRIAEIHECRSDSESNMEAIIVYRVIHEEPYWAGWVLVQSWIAGMEEVQDGEAEFVGDIVSQLVLGIKYCPFCGCLLSEPKLIEPLNDSVY